MHSAAGWRPVLEPVVARYRGTVKRLFFRGDAAFASPEMYEFVEAEGIGYTIRLPSNQVLQGRIRYLLKRPVGRPPQEVRRYFASFGYQVQSWNKPRRVVAKVEWHPGELYPRDGFIITNLARPAERVVAFYNQRGTCEQYIKEGQNAIKWTRLSYRTFAASTVRLQLHALAYNLGNFMRTLEADQDRRQGRQPRALRCLPDGRGRGAATDVRRHPVADRPAAGPSMTNRSGQMRWTTTPEVRRDEAKAASFGFAKPSASPFLAASRAPAIEFRCSARRRDGISRATDRESGECRLISSCNGLMAYQRYQGHVRREVS